jgi:hypothetical protein
MITYPSKTAHLVSRLEKIASAYASRSDYANANYAKGSISDLRSAKMGGPQFALLEKRTYREAISLGISWDEEWLPKGVTKKPMQTPHSDSLRYDKMISYLCSRISEIRTTCQLSTHEHNAAQNFFWYLKDQRHSEMYRTALWIEGICKKYGVAWSPGMSLSELRDYLETNYPFSEIKGKECEIEVRAGNPCAEIELPKESPKQELNPMHLI